MNTTLIHELVYIYICIYKNTATRGCPRGDIEAPEYFYYPPLPQETVPPPQPPLRIFITEVLGSGSITVFLVSPGGNLGAP